LNAKGTFVVVRRYDDAGVPLLVAAADFDSET
jgi:hypothetical protein